MRNKFMVLLLTFVIVAGSSVTALAADMLEGRPAPYEAGSSAGYNIWQDGDRWNVQMVNTGSRHSFNGTIETDGAFSNVSAMASENSDRIAMKVRSQKIEFNYNSLAKSDGFSFTLPNSQNATFTLYIDGAPVDPSRIYLGRQNRHPNSYSFSSANLQNYYSNSRNDQINPNDNRVFPSYNDQSDNSMNLSRFQGQPTAIYPGNVPGYFIWQEGDRWFMKTATHAERHNFTGSIRTFGVFSDARRINLEDNDIVRMNGASNEISFDLKTESDQDGISFQLSNSTDATFTLYIDGQAINPSDIYLGSQNLHPATNPFSLNSRDNQYTTNDNRILPSSNLDNSTTYQTIVSSYAQGRPSELNPGKSFGCFIWQNDQNRWILQTSTTGAVREFTGTIETGGMFSDVRSIPSQRSYGSVVDTASNSISFTFKTGDSDQARRSNELSFNVTDGSDLRFRLFVDGQPIDPANIYLGKANYHPSGNALKIYSSNR